MGLILILSPFLLLLPRIVLIDLPKGKEFFFILPFEKIKISFVNSVTSKPVQITFRPTFYFGSFQMITDKETEAYYTGGIYSIQESLRDEVRKVIFVCSQTGMEICIGVKCHELKEGCGKLRLVWPP